MSVNVGATISNPVTLTPSPKSLTLTAATHGVTGTENNQTDVMTTLEALSLNGYSTQINDDSIVGATFGTLTLSGFNNPIDYTPVQGNIQIDAESAAMILAAKNAESVEGTKDDPPVINGTPSVSFVEGTGNTYSLASVVTDDSATPLTYTLNFTPPSTVTLNSSTGLLTYTPTAGDDTASSSGTFTVSDAGSQATSNSFNITIAEAVGTTDLELLANSMVAGDEWQELTTTGLSAAIDVGGDGADGNILTYGNSGNVWHHTRRKIYWIGGDHNGGDNRFITYDDDTNSWSTEPFNSAFGGNGQGHGYFRNSLDQTGDRFWWSENLYDIATGVWTDQPKWTDPANQDQARFPSDWFPDLGLVFFHDGRLDILRNGTTAGGWSRLGTGFGDMTGDSNHLFACYSPKKNHMIFGGGDGGETHAADALKIWRLDSDESTPTRLTDLPFEVSSRSGSGGQLTTDPVTGKFLYLRESNQTLYEFDATLDDGWNVHSTTSHLTSTVNRTVLFPIQSYGVLLQIEYISPGVSKMWVYKHHNSQTLEQVDSDPDTLSWFDYETPLHHPEDEAYFVGTFGMANEPLTDTNDPGGYVRNNANSAAYLQGSNAVANTGSDFQVNGGGGWNTSYYQEIVEGNLPPAMYPRHEDGVGEFENLTGTSGRTAMKIITRQGYAVGGDIVYALKRSPAPPDTTAPFSFLTAGEGAEIWLRFAIKHNDDWLATPQTPTAPKRSIYQGRDSTSDLEETLQNVQPHTGGTGENFLMYTNENSGGKIHPTFSPPLVESRDWTIIHIRHVTGTEGVDDAITELYVNEETSPRFTDLTIDTSDGEGPLISGLQFIDTSSTNTNQGYWKFRLTTFHTSRDGTQASNDLVVWYDNLIIRENTRCPALRPSTGTITTSDTTIAMWDTTEFELTAPGVGGNKFDAIATVTFTHDTETDIVTEMFYVGSDTWKFRFTGVKQGIWSYTTSSAIGDLNGNSGTITVTANADTDAYGFLTNSGNKWAVLRGNTPTTEGFIYNTFQHQNSDRTNHTNTTGIRDRGIIYMTDQEIDWYLDEAEAAGTNVIFFLPMVAGDHTSAWPVVWTDGNPTYNPAFDMFDAVDNVLDKAKARGMFVDFWLHGEEERGTSPSTCFPNGHLGAEDQRMLRYIAARMGPKTNWTMQIGFDLQQWTVNQDQTVNEWSAFLNSKMSSPYRHMFSGRGYGTTSDVKAYSGDVVPTYNDAVNNLASDSGRPHHFAERHYTGNSPRANSSQILAGMWEFTMAGGHGGHWGVRYSGAIDGNYRYPTSLNGEEMKTHFAFWHTGKRFMLNMSANNGLVNTGYCLESAANQNYVIWVQNTDTVIVDLSGMSGTQAVVAVDTDAIYSEVILSSVTPGSGKVIDLPSVGDWAIAIGDF